VYRQLDKLPRSLTLPAGKDTAFVCREGTTIILPANAFIFRKTGRPVTGSVQFRVKEYYSVADALLADLSTMTKDKLLQSASMVYLEATADGEACAVRDGAMVKIGFPYREKQEGVQLFNGYRENDNMIWEAAGTPPEEVQMGEQEVIFQVVENMPEFRGGPEKLNEQFVKHLRCRSEKCAGNRFRGVCGG
jgi:hypothetical protein